MADKWVQDAILSALEERIIKLELTLETAPCESSLEIRADLKACRSLLVKVRENFGKLNAIEGAHS
jgi:hypothetical protein